MRTRYFPPERNYLNAHITLFHALPEERREVWFEDLRQMTCAQFDVRMTDAYSLGRGTALRVDSPELTQIRNAFAANWRDFLSPQDRQGYRPHCTLQNKVNPAEAAATLAELKRAWQPFSARALGLELWEYLGGPWRIEQSFSFS